MWSPTPMWMYFNPRSPHGERHFPRNMSAQTMISTHAPRTGSDFAGGGSVNDLLYFNPRSPHGERRDRQGGGDSTPHFNPRSPHGERRRGAAQSCVPQNFNPRSPHGERHAMAWAIQRVNAFQPTLPARGATDARTLGHRERPISTHAPRTGSDICGAITLVLSLNFNPRSPHGERRCFFECIPIGCQFQPTLPARGATVFSYS